MTPQYLRLTPHDPLVARDGRPFGSGQGTRMRGLPWPLPSVVAGSLRTALVKASESHDFSGDMPTRLLRVAVAGLFPVCGATLYLPAPGDAVAQPAEDRRGIAAVHRAAPCVSGGGCDFPGESLLPVLLPNDVPDFKPATLPAWWPVAALERWLLGEGVTPDATFLGAALQEQRDHVCLDPVTGTAAEGQLFTTAGLNLTHLPRFGVDADRALRDRFAEVALTLRVASEELSIPDAFWHPLGGERRLVHWGTTDGANLWACRQGVRDSLANAKRVRMVLATPAIFADGWKPRWLGNDLVGSPPGCAVRLRLVGVSIGRWKAVSGWSLVERGPKPIRRMVPAGGVYFFERVDGDPAALADRWLQPVSDDTQDPDHAQARNDGFGLAVWGHWNPHA